MEKAPATTETEFTRNTSGGTETATNREVLAGGAADQKEQTIRVQALRRFHKGENMQGEMVDPGDQFDCPRSRAAQLRANGLISYVNDSDGAKLHGEDASDRLARRDEADAKLRELPEKHKTTPLRNPELKLADVPASKK